MANNNDKEIWKEVPGYEGLYQVSSFGRIKSLNYKNSGIEQILCISPRDNKYTEVGLNKDGIRTMFYVHRLVLSAFSPCQGMEHLEVNHKDENKSNNMLTNLEWCTRSYNNSYGSLPAKRAEIARGNKYHLGKSHSEESKRKISQSKKGKPLSAETRKKMSESQMGEKNGFYGKHHSEETKRKIAAHRIGTHQSEAQKKKMSDLIKRMKWWHDSQGNATRAIECPGKDWLPGRK